MKKISLVLTMMMAFAIAFTSCAQAKDETKSNSLTLNFSPDSSSEGYYYSQFISEKEQSGIKVSIGWYVQMNSDNTYLFGTNMKYTPVSDEMKALYKSLYGDNIPPMLIPMIKGNYSKEKNKYKISANYYNATSSNDNTSTATTQNVYTPNWTPIDPVIENWKTIDVAADGSFSIVITSDDPVMNYLQSKY